MIIISYSCFLSAAMSFVAAAAAWTHIGLLSCCSDMGTDVLKTGMLSTVEVVQLVASKIRQYGLRQVVIDPVMVSTSGHALACNEVMVAMREHLFPLATVVTPNIPEAMALLGGRPIASIADMELAAAELHKLGPRYVLESAYATY